MSVSVKGFQQVFAHKPVHVAADVSRHPSGCHVWVHTGMLTTPGHDHSIVDMIGERLVCHTPQPEAGISDALNVIRILHSMGHPEVELDRNADDAWGETAHASSGGVPGRLHG